MIDFPKPPDIQRVVSYVAQYLEGQGLVVTPAHRAEIERTVTEQWRQAAAAEYVRKATAQQVSPALKSIHAQTKKIAKAAAKAGWNGW